MQPVVLVLQPIVLYLSSELLKGGILGYRILDFFDRKSTQFMPPFHTQDQNKKLAMTYQPVDPTSQ